MVIQIMNGKKGVELWSVKLISGENLITELYVEDDDSLDVIMVNPYTIITSETETGETTYARPYDQYTDDEEIEIAVQNFLSVPTTVNLFYRTFYVRALMFNYVKKSRSELESLDLSPHEANVKIKEIEEFLANIAKNLEEKFDIELMDSIKDEDGEVKKDEVKKVVKNKPLLH